MQNYSMPRLNITIHKLWCLTHASLSCQELIGNTSAALPDQALLPLKRKTVFAYSLWREAARDQLCLIFFLFDLTMCRGERVGKRFLILIWIQHLELKYKRLSVLIPRL